jgi:predicted phosphodiesterase
MASIERAAFDRVAVISDVHGNAVALQAVLAEVLRERPDALVNLGCLTYGPQPSLVAEMLNRAPIPVLSVRGNGDRAVLQFVDGARQPTTARDRFVVGHHNDVALSLLRGTKPELRLEITGLGTVLFCHGSPRSDVELITPATPVVRLREAIGGRACGVLATGHTHLQFDRPLDIVRSVGPGSVGLPYHDGPPGARWALLGPDVQLRVTGYDIDEAAAAATGAEFPDADQWSQVLRQPPTVAEVVADAESRIYSD